MRNPIPKPGKDSAKGNLIALGCALLAVCLSACSSAPRSAQEARNVQLIRAAEKGSIKDVYRLIEAGADVNGRDKEGWTPYLAASSMGQLDAMRVLRAFGAKTIPPDLLEENIAHQRFPAN